MVTCRSKNFLAEKTYVGLLKQPHSHNQVQELHTSSQLRQVNIKFSKKIHSQITDKLVSFSRGDVYITQKQKTNLDGHILALTENG
jgi:hypothetical protein